MKNKGKQSISNGIDAMEIYLGILGCFPQAMHILNVISRTNIPFINSGEYYSIIRLACKEKKKR